MATLTTWLNVPAGEPLDLAKADVMLLAYEYRNAHDKATLDAIAAELERRSQGFADSEQTARYREESERLVSQRRAYEACGGK